MKAAISWGPSFLLQDGNREVDPPTTVPWPPLDPSRRDLRQLREAWLQEGVGVGIRRPAGARAGGSCGCLRKRTAQQSLTLGTAQHVPDPPCGFSHPLNLPCSWEECCKVRLIVSGSQTWKLSHRELGEEQTAVSLLSHGP
jgi:hypothetical protein